MNELWTAASEDESRLFRFPLSETLVFSVSFLSVQLQTIIIIFFDYYYFFALKTTQ